MARQPQDGGALSAAGPGDRLRLVPPAAAELRSPGMVGSPAELGSTGMLDDDDLGPARREGAAGPLGLYVAGALMDGRALFAVLADRFVQDRIDEQPHLLDDLACDALVGAAMSRRLAVAEAVTSRSGLPLAV